MSSITNSPDYDDGLKELLESNRYKEYLQAMSHFHNYSRRNILLILRQMPHATACATISIWNKAMNRYVKKGTKGIALLDNVDGNSIEKSEYDEKRKELLDELETASQEQSELLSAVKNDSQLKKRLAEFKAVLEQSEVMSEFDPTVFESMIEKIIIGEVDERGNKNPNKITFVFKTGYTSDAYAQPPKKAGRPKQKG